MQVQLLTGIVVCLLSCANSSRILVLGPLSTISHKLSYMPIIEGLAEKGHQITIVTGYKSKNAIPNIREILIPNFFDENPQQLGLTELRQFRGWLMLAVMFTQFRDAMIFTHDHLMNSEVFQQILRDRDVDLVILDSIFNDVCHPIIDHLGVPFVSLSSSTGPAWILGSLGASQEYASIPTLWTDFGRKMNFYQRMMNSLTGVITTMARNWIITRSLDSYVKKYFPEASRIEDLERRCSLMIVANFPALAWPRSLPPNIIEIGGLHLRPVQPLSQDLQKFADESGENGFVIFTLGSIINSASMPEEISQIFVRVFSQIPQRVIWKWENGHLQNVSSNVLLVQWLPQQDLLGHANAKLFITHGGLLGYQEAVYHAVPLLGLPIINDQDINVAKFVEDGCGLKLDWNELSEVSLLDTITTLINDPSFKANVTRKSHIIRDELIGSRDRGVYWIEYILRHGGEHLRMSSVDMPFYQKYLLDIIGFLSVIFFILSIAFVCILRGLLRKLFSERKLPHSKSE